MPAFWLSKEGLPALNGNATMPEAMLALAPPSVRLWAEVSVAVAIGCLCCLALAGATFYRRSREKHPLTMMMLVLWTFVLCLPFFLPMRFGLSASTVAILNFIGSWKAVDCFMGTQPTALTSNGFFPFAVHFASPVEFKLLTAKGDPNTSQKESIQRATKDLWQKEGIEVVFTVLGLSFCASVRNVLQFVSTPAPPPLVHFGHEALFLYTEVWTIYLFLSFFSGVFSTLLALLQFQAKTMFDQPLLKSTSISEFWSRRWNMLIHGLFKRTVFRPLTRQGFPPWSAGALAFVISGLFHEYAFSLAQPSLRQSLGRCMCFFVAQAPIVSVEKALRKQIRVPWPFKEHSAACTIAWTVLLVPMAPLFLHPLRTSGVLDEIFSLVPRFVVTAA